MKPKNLEILELFTGNTRDAVELDLLRQEAAEAEDLSGVNLEMERCLSNAVALMEAIQSGRDYEPIDLFAVIRDAKAVLAMKARKQ